MAGHGAPEIAVPDAAGLTLGIVATDWNAGVVGQLEKRALEAAADAKVSDVKVIHVAGAVELPIAAQALARRYDAVVALGTVIRGGTAHFDYVCKSVTEGLTRVALDEATPVAHGVLTVDDQEQALARAGFPDSTEDKGYEAVVAALGAALAIRSLDA
ncbi:6,7-dimethyl-8-ribityllumazine synthase [Glycomyces sp. TRM65418]|uniref:6,7-dimethyl-8-ribityllumazine synthase n=1 Tax=Glycomyces sp. TRM65418 TaxID=2867006 RepID=UPI001CE5486B|nr:6,7-dimethyl-8-ribityllumazine synthase [Glycomyces sp. TRM65418]MCC3764423.1 6,7-dimethyl-8-ribityllumazine synthase [Glycomyces sp. TRM65418]QZD54098.1 6,7-dimethyl-8-ribityllumazine synthase [Glycomyces sp. TRM65418]